MQLLREIPICGGTVHLFDDHFSMIADGIPVFAFPISCTIDTVYSDRDLFLSPPSVQENGDVISCTWTSVSEAWTCKTYLLDIYPDGCYFRIRLQGNGTPDTIRYFTGHIDGSLHAGTMYEAAGYALPEAANFDEARMTRFINHDGSIGMGFMTPPPLVFPFWTVGTNGTVCDTWVGVGLAVHRGQYNFNRFFYQVNNSTNRCAFELPLEGRTTVSGTWETQGIWCGFGKNAADTVSEYAEFLYRHDFCSRGQRNKERFWRGPLYCGWGDQVEWGGSLLSDDHINAACQSFYSTLSDLLDSRRLHPTAIIIDDKWQDKYGTLLPDPAKWPDLRAFADEQHTKGRRVVLWVKVWNAEGLDADECMLLEGQPYAADPTSPKYRRRIFETVRTLLSAEEGCYNCDGFKLDFVNCILMHPSIRPYDRSVFGLELVRQMMELFYEAAKAAKPDALINNSCAHPYFADITDQVRLHDYRDSMRSMMPVMEYRRDMFRAAMPDALIDTDSSNRSNYREAKEYCLRAAELGVPDLYLIGDAREFRFSEEDWDAVREVWETYSAAADKASCADIRETVTMERRIKP